MMADAPKYNSSSDKKEKPKGKGKELTKDNAADMVEYINKLTAQNK